MEALGFFGLYFSIVCWLIYEVRRLKPSRWWIRMNTADPACTYYFGPFDSRFEAKTHARGYIDDLLAEGARDINYTIERSSPKYLTVEHYQS